MNPTPVGRSTFLTLFSPLLFLLCLSFSAPRWVVAQEPLYSQNDRPEWQWSVPLEGFSDKPVSARAYLWIPPGCQRLRGVVVGQQNMQEEQIFENPIFRRALAELDFGVIWVAPPYDLFFRFDRGSGEKFDAMLGKLAGESGYSELPLVPVVPIGHSAAASSPWNFGAWAPERTLAAISVSGQWPYYKDVNTPEWGDLKVDGLPGLVTIGEYEGGLKRAETGVWQRREHPKLPLSMFAESGGEHFAATDRKITYIGQYLRKVAAARLPTDWPIDQRPKLKEIDPEQQGWLADRGRPEGKPLAPAAPVAKYKGDPKEAFWYFDQELAEEAEQASVQHAGKKMQFAGYLQKDGLVAQRKSHVRTNLRVEIEEDDLTFKLGSALLETAPADWGDFKAGDPVTHAADASKLAITRICGPVDKINDNTFALRFSRGMRENPAGSAAMSFILSHPGDDAHKPAVLESEIKIWTVNKQGQEQQIEKFVLPESVSAGTRSLELEAKSSSGLPVFFYVREGPAVVDGNTLRFTDVPPRSKFPINTTIVAWQWGRSAEPKVQSAQPVERTIVVTK